MKTRFNGNGGGTFYGNNRAVGVAGPASGRVRQFRSPLGETHVLRLEVVARARKLIKQENYPSRDIIMSVADMLAGNLKQNRGHFQNHL
jgi:hypothetical protein